MIKVKKLSTTDFLQYKKLRLEMLEKYPAYFGSSFEEEILFKDMIWMNRLNKSTAITFGLMKDNDLIGMVVLMLNQRRKMQHFATVYSMHVKDTYQGKGYGKLLLEKVFSKVKELGVEKIRLSVVYTNNKAIELYKKLGFNPYGVEKGTIKYNNEYFDLLLMEKEMRS